MDRPYPPAPWNLQGHGMQTLQLVTISSIKHLIPKELAIVPVLPNRTLGVVAFAHYGTGSVLEYNELIVAPAVVRHQGRIGVWVSHIYVDNPISVQGGREIWGVPKQQAEFTWNDDGNVGQVSASMNGTRLCSAAVSNRWWIMRKSIDFPTYSHLDGDLIRFVGRTSGRIGWGRGTVDIPAESPFANIEMSRPKLSLWIQDLTLICDVPERVGKTTATIYDETLLPEPLPAACAEEPTRA